MNISPIISIIVPFFNAEKYLNRCIDSILSQTFSDFEILLINDGASIGAGAVILGGITFGKSEMIGSGGVVTKNVSEILITLIKRY